MNVWLVVPVRSLQDGKRRLAPVLDQAERAALVEWLLERTLAQASEFPGLDRTLVVSACRQTRTIAGARGARTIGDCGTGLNEALEWARSAVFDAGAERMLVVPADLPALTADDLRECAAAAIDGAIAIAPDRARDGTNGLCLPASCAFEFAFGTDSFARHIEGAVRLGVQPAIVERPGLAFDVDLPADLQEIADLPCRRS